MNKYILAVIAYAVYIVYTIVQYRKHPKNRIYIIILDVVVTALVAYATYGSLTE